MSLEHAMLVGYPCSHCWDHIRDFATWTPRWLGSRYPLSGWTMWYAEYVCILCREVRVLPKGDWPVGGRVYNMDEVWNEEWDELLEGVEIDDEDDEELDWECEEGNRNTPDYNGDTLC